MNFYRKDKGIISLVAILTIGLFALSAVTISLMGALKELTKNRNNVMGERSFYTAEAAAREGVYQYKKHSASSSYSGGNAILLNDSSTAQITVNSLPWPYGEVIGFAINDMPNGTTTRKVIFTTTVFPEGEAFDYALYGGANNIDLRGSEGLDIKGNIFSNGTIECSGNPNTEGDFFSPNTTDNDCSGDKFIADYISPPVINPDDFIAEATFASTSLAVVNYLNENYDLNNPIIGIIFADDTSEMTLKKANLKGALVVNGNLSLGGGDVTIDGIVYVAGKTTFKGGGGKINIKGSLISLGGIEKLAGSVTIEYNKDSASIWKDLFDHSTTGYSNPTPINWREE